MNLSWQVKEVDVFRTSNGPQKFCIELEADWLIILDETCRKSPGWNEWLGNKLDFDSSSGAEPWPFFADTFPRDIGDRCFEN